MKTTINISMATEDINRFSSREDLRNFYHKYGCSGLEVMTLPGADEISSSSFFQPDMVTGVHLCCRSDWMNQTPEQMDQMIAEYQSQMAWARQMHAEYIVFHATQVCTEEIVTYRPLHTDREVIDALVPLINRILSAFPDEPFLFLMENLWWPGLTFLNPPIAEELISRINYKKKGLILDTGHLLHMNHELASQEEAISYLNAVLDKNTSIIPWIRGVHLQQSLTGEYIKNFLANPPEFSKDPVEYACQCYEHIFAIDRHEPFTCQGIPELIQRIQPDYVTYEYITRSREEHARYLEAGSRALIGGYQ